MELDNDEKLVFFSILKSVLFYLTNDRLSNFKSELDKIFTKEPLDISEIIPLLKEEKNKFTNLIIPKPTDYQTNYTREIVHFTDFEKYTKYKLDLNYTAILITLGTNDFPLSVKTITELFPKAFELAFKNFSCNFDTSDEKNIKNASDTSKNLSENRIYRLLQDLKNDGLVIEAVRQISKDSSKFSILYTSTGKKTIYLENIDEFWKQELKWRNLVLLIGKILKYHFKKENLDEKTFFTLFTKIIELKFESYKQMLNNVSNQEISNFYHHSLNVIESNTSISAFGAINVFFQDEDIFSLTKQLYETFKYFFPNSFIWLVLNFKD